MMLEKSREIADRRIKEHLSISISLIVFLLLIICGGLAFSFRIAAGLAITGGVIYNHLLCRRLGAQAARDSSA